MLFPFLLFTLCRPLSASNIAAPLNLLSPGLPAPPRHVLFSPMFSAYPPAPKRQCYLRQMKSLYLFTTKLSAAIVLRRVVDGAASTVARGYSLGGRCTMPPPPVCLLPFCPWLRRRRQPYCVYSTMYVHSIYTKLCNTSYTAGGSTVLAHSACAPVRLRWWASKLSGPRGASASSPAFAGSSPPRRLRLERSETDSIPPSHHPRGRIHLRRPARRVLPLVGARRLAFDPVQIKRRWEYTDCKEVFTNHHDCRSNAQVDDTTITPSLPCLSPLPPPPPGTPNHSRTWSFDDTQIDVPS